MKQLIFVLYDGIENSVFQGQVLQPLIDQLESGTVSNVSLISFERTRPSNQKIKKLISDNKKINITFFKKFPFTGTFSLWPAVIKLKKFLARKKNYHIVARGPLAGWACKKALSKKNISSLTVQARGLLAAEYEYTTKNKNYFLKKIVNKIRTKQFYNLEKNVYKKPTHIEAVSTALKNYLVTEFNANPRNISIAHKDIPQKIQPAKISIWRQKIRKKLDIPLDAHVYCFNGSAKAWQCPDKVVSFFSEKIKKNKNCFLLVLTQDVHPFMQLLKSQKIPDKTYIVLTVDHKKIYRYLSACDTGLLFREKNLVNWVSRPTKILEYRAVGLNVIHNNTVEFLKTSLSFAQKAPTIKL